MSELPALHIRCAELLELLVSLVLSFTVVYDSHYGMFNIMLRPLQVEGNRNHHSKVVKLLQDIFELVTNDMMTDSSWYDLNFIL